MKMLRITYLESEEQFGIWDRFVVQIADSSIFNTAEIARQFAENLDLKHTILAVFKGDELIAGFSFLFKQIQRKIVIVNPPLMTYNGLVLRKNIAGEISMGKIASMILEELSRKFDYLELFSNPDFNNLECFETHNFKSEIKYTYIAPLDDLDKLYQGFNLKLKNRISKASRAEFRFAKKEHSTDVGNLFNLWKTSYIRGGNNVPINKDAFEKLLPGLMLEKLVEVFELYVEDILVASYAVLVYNKKVILWLGGDERTYSYGGFNSLIHWEIMKYYHGKGYKSIDFLGANSPSISVFKSKFNFQLKPYYFMSKYRNVYTQKYLRILKMINPQLSIWKFQ